MSAVSRVSGSLQSGGDVDRFVLDVVAGENYFFEALFSATRSDSDSTQLTLEYPQSPAITFRNATGSPERGYTVGFAWTATRSGPITLSLYNESEPAATLPYAIQAVRTPVDDHGSTPATATLLGLDATTLGRFDWGADSDVFAVDAAAGQHIVLDVVATPLPGQRTVRLRAFVRDADGQEIGNFFVAMDAPLGVGFTASSAGRYTVELRSRDVEAQPGGASAGTYQVTAHALPADDHADLRAAATTLTAAQPMPLVLNHLGDIDWFRIALPAGQQQMVSVATPRGSLAPSVELFDAAGTSFPGGSAGLVFEPLAAGDYFVKVSSPLAIANSAQARGNHVLTVQAAPADDVPGTTAKALPLTVGQDISGSFLSTGDVDMFRFEAVAGQRYSWALLGQSQNFDTAGLRFLRADGTAALELDATLYSSVQASRPIHEFQAERSETVYVRLAAPSYEPIEADRPYRYSLHSATLAADDHGSTRASATPLAMGLTTLAQLTVGDLDVFRVELLAGQRYRIETRLVGAETQDQAPLSVEIFAATGSSPIAWTYDRATSVFEPPSSSSYFIAVNGEQVRVAVSYMPLAADDHGDSSLTATRLVAGAQFDLAGLSLLGSVGADQLLGSARADRLSGGDGRDTLRGVGGDDVIDGGSGIDTAQFAGRRVDYALRTTAEGWQLEARVGSAGLDGNDTLHGVERLAFDGEATRLALDLDANAGNVAKIIGALFSKATLSDAKLVGIGLKLLDDGIAYPELIRLAVATDLFAQRAGSHGNADFVRWVYANVVGQSAPADAVAHYTGLLESGTYSQATLALLACETELNRVQIDLVGLANTGLAFLPAG
jgi:RTX calcium-binding nonapeptide repeat (4 copies)